jgi:hypothetical protein
MNDRVSKKPPTTYICTEEELRSKFDYEEQEDARGRKLARSRKLTTRANSSVAASSVADRSDSSRHSNIFRFGKSLAATFNPSNWKIWSKQQQPVEDEETAQLRALHERKQKAERIYQELKEAGHFRGRSVGPREPESVSESNTLHGKHDSGIEFAGHDTGSARVSRELSREDKRKGRIFLEAPRISRDCRDESPVSNAGSAVPSNASSPTKQSFHFKKTSLSNIKKVFINENTSNATVDSHYQRPVSRIPSRKDLQKQQKLVKRVSDLEGKLEAARRQLSEALNEPVPDQPTSKVGRSRFVPGALASLPSERLLSGYISSDPGFSDNESHIEVGKAIMGDYMEDNEVIDQKFVAPTHKLAASPLWVGKPLTRPGTLPQDRVLPTVEREELIREKAVSDVGHMAAETATTISEPSTKAYDPNDFDYVEEKSEGETTTKRRPAKATTDQTPTKKTPTKKRKSNFERLADDGGQYKPSQDADSDPESEVKKTTPRKQNVGARPRKLQKIVPESNGDASSKASASKSMKTPSSSQDHISTPGARGNNQNKGSGNASMDASSVPGRRNSLKAMKKLTSPPPPDRMAKSKILPKGKQSFSPPPSSSFTGLDYMKPSLSKQTTKHVAELVDNNVAYSADPTTDDNIPPMPAIPKAIRLSSGEVVKTSTSFGSGASKTSAGPTKLTKPRPAHKESVRPENKKQDNDEADDDFHWDRDTF